MQVASDSIAAGLAIAIVGASVSRAAGGIFPIMRAHARQLARMGASVSVFGLTDAFSEFDAPAWAPVSLRLFKPVYQGFAYAPVMARELLKAQFDIVHQHGLWLYPSIAVSRWRQHGRRPVVISTQGMLEPWALRNSRTKKAIAARLFERSNLRHAACLHCSHAEVEGVRRFGLKNPIAVLPNGADLPRQGMPHARPEWLPSDGRRTLLFLGRLHPKKGIRETLEAWALLKVLAPDIARRWRLVTAGWGDGGHGESFVAHAHALGISGDVLFPGQIFGSEKEAVLAHADAFILASHSEGLPIAVLEAWAHRVPVLMTRQCNLPEGFTTGAAVEVTSEPARLADGLASFLGLPEEELLAMGARGRRLVEANFAWEGIAAQVAAVYAWVLGRQPKPPCVSID
jgi:poly(glycerol-phosphate) alpha-glucosyltransferase